MKPGDKVELINISDLDCEISNWISKEPTLPEIGEIFIVKDVYYCREYIILEGLIYLHHIERFKLVQ